MPPLPLRPSACRSWPALRQGDDVTQQVAAPAAAKGADAATAGALVTA